MAKPGRDGETRLPAKPRNITYLEKLSRRCYAPYFLIRVKGRDMKSWMIASAFVLALGSSANAQAPVPAAPTAPKPAATPATPPPPGAEGQVWVNTASHVYHCSGTKYYGNTKKGQYMTEAAAKTAGNHADHGKACS